MDFFSSEHQQVKGCIVIDAQYSFLQEVNEGGPVTKKGPSQLDNVPIYRNVKVRGKSETTQSWIPGIYAAKAFFFLLL